MSPAGVQPGGDPAGGGLVLVFTNAPDVATAEAIARAAVEQRAAACVNVLAPCQSIYRWQGELQEESEIPMILKTTRERLDALEALVARLHPYEVPEFVALPASRCLPAYAAWAWAETSPAAITGGDAP